MPRAWLEAEVDSPVTHNEPQRSDPLLASIPQIRAGKIAQLRRAVESGAYCVSAEQMAEKMVREALAEMLTEGLQR
jgi:anti-sigma28 factor (negative regulator of flagellin synthesis)